MVDVSSLPTFDSVASAQQTANPPARSNALIAGVKSGFYGALGDVGEAAQAGLHLLGRTSDQAQALANYGQQQAAATGRPDLDQKGWFDSPGTFLSKAAYTIGQTIPSTVGAGAAAALGAAAAPEVGLAGLAGAAAFMAPQSIGQQYKAVSDEAAKQGRTATTGETLRAAGVGTALGVLNAYAGGLDAHALSNGIVSGIGKSALYTAGLQGAGSVISGAADIAGTESYDPNKSVGDIATDMLYSIPKNFLVGAGLGAFFGAAGGALAARRATLPSAKTTDIAALTSQLDPNAPQAAPAPAAGIDGLSTQARAIDGPYQQSALPPDLPTRAVNYGGDQTGGAVAPDLVTRPVNNVGDQLGGGKVSDLLSRAVNNDGDQIGGKLPVDLPAFKMPEQQELDLRMGFGDRHEGYQPNLFEHDDAPPALMGDAPAPGQPMADIAPQPLSPAQQLQRRAQRERELQPPEAQTAPDQPANIEELLAQLHDDSPAQMPVALDQARGDARDQVSQAVYSEFGDDGQTIGTTGVMRDFLDNTNVTNDADLYNKLKDEYDQGSKVSKTAGFKRMAQEVGLFGEDNKPFDLDAERQDAASLPNAGARAAAQADVERIADRQARAAAMRDPETSQAVSSARPNETGDQLGGQRAPDELSGQAQRGAFDSDRPDPMADSRKVLADAAISRDRRRIQQMFDGPDRRAAAPDAAADPVAPAAAEAPKPPRSIADQVTDAAHELTGGTGGEARIADLRAKLPNVAPEDFENALRTIHGDDTDNTLTQAPKGQRQGVDGVSVPGQGKFHSLSIEPRETDAVQERSPETLSGSERSESSGGVSQGDAKQRETTGAQQDEGSAAVSRASTEGGTEASQAAQAPDAINPAAPTSKIGNVLKSKALRARDGAYRDDDTESARQQAEAARQQSDAALPADPLRQGIRAEVEKARGETLKPIRTTGSKTGAALTSKALKPREGSANDVVVRTPRRVSNQTFAGMAENILRYRAEQAQVKRVRDQPIENVTQTTVADLNRELSKPEPAIPARGDDVVKPFVRDESNAPQDAPAGNRDAIRKSFNDIVSTLPEGTRGSIHLVDTAGDLPVSVRNQLTAQSLRPEEVNALVHRGEVYVVGDHMRNSADIEDMLAHEVFGHVGTEKLLDGKTGGNYETALTNIFDKAGGIDGLNNLAKQFGVYDLGNGGGFKHYLDVLGIDPKNMSGRDKALLTDELIAHASQSRVFSSSQKMALGFVARLKQAIAASFRGAGMDSFASKFEKFGVADVQKFLNDSRALLEDRQPEGTIDLSKIPGDRLAMIMKDNRDLLMPSMRAPEASKGVQEQMDDAGGVMKTLGPISQMARKLPLDTLARVFRTNYLKTFYRADFERLYNKTFPEFERDGKLVTVEQNISKNVQQYRLLSDRQYKQLKDTDRAKFDMHNNMLAQATMNQLDPTKPTVSPERIAGFSAEKAADIQALQKELHATWNKLGQPGKDGAPSTVQQMYRDREAANKADYMFAHINNMHNLADIVTGGVKGFEINAVRDLATRTDFQNKPQAAADFARAELAKRTDAMQQFITDAAASKRVDPQVLDALKNGLDNTNDAIKKMDALAYAHLGRVGDYGVRFVIKRGADGRPDPASVEAIRNALNENGYSDVMFNQVADNPAVFVKLQSLEAATGLADLVGGKYDKGEGKRIGGLQEHLDTGEELTSGSILDRNKIASKDISPALKLIEDHLSEKLKDYPATRDAAIAAARGLWFDSLPNTSSVRMEAHRTNVNGASNDLMKTSFIRNEVAANAIAKGATHMERSEISSSIMKRMSDAQRLDTVESTKVGDVGGAFLDRNNAQSTRVETAIFDRLRGYAHSFYLGASPGYVIMQAAQPYTLTLPELAKHTSYVKAASALTSSVLDTGKVLASLAQVQKEILSAQWRGEVSPHQGGITERMLEIAKSKGLSDDKIELLRQVDNRGQLEAGTFAHESFSGLQAEAKSSVGGKVLSMLNATATNAELMGRLVSTFASHKVYTDAAASGKMTGSLAKFDNVHDFAAHVTAQSMMEWGSSQTSKMFSKSGPLGPATPLVTQFHGFGVKLFNKLYAETYNAFKGDTPEEQTEARRFLLAHLTATASIAGVMGLPAAAWAAAAITKASTIMPGSSGEAYDVNSHMQSFIASILGKSVGEAIFHGLPRFLNTDFSNLGDKDLLPMTDLLEDRRKMEESIPDYLSKAWGSSIGAGVNVLMGARDISNGEVMKGLTRMLPTAMKDQFKAYQISQRGYVDSQGNPLPIDSNALSVLKQALGVQSGDVQDYQEKSRAETGAKDDRQYHSGIIKRNLAIAMESGDNDGYTKWMQAAQDYDADPSHLGMPIMPTISAYMMARRRAQMYSRVSGLPIGTSMKDLPAMQLLNY